MNDQRDYMNEEEKAAAEVEVRSLWGGVIELIYEISIQSPAAYKILSYRERFGNICQRLLELVY